MNVTPIPVVEPTYRKSPMGAIVSLIMAMLYGASPIDLIPDFIIAIGQADDIVVIGFLAVIAWNLAKKRKRSTAMP